MMYAPQNSGAMIFFRDPSDVLAWVVGFDWDLLQIWAGSTRNSLSTVVCRDINELRSTIKRQIYACDGMNYYISNVLSLDFERDIRDMRLVESGVGSVPTASLVEIANFLGSHGLYVDY